MPFDNFKAISQSYAIFIVLESLYVAKLNADKSFTFGSILYKESNESVNVLTPELFPYIAFVPEGASFNTTLTGFAILFQFVDFGYTSTFRETIYIQYKK